MGISERPTWKERAEELHTENAKLRADLAQAKVDKDCCCAGTEVLRVKNNALCNELRRVADAYDKRDDELKAANLQVGEMRSALETIEHMSEFSKDDPILISIHSISRHGLRSVEKRKESP